MIQLSLVTRYIKLHGTVDTCLVTVIIPHSYRKCQFN